MININLGSLFNMTRHVIEGMRERNFGRIINISSINGQKGQFGQTNYSAAKAGDDRLHQGAGAGERQEAASPSTPSRPGYIDTEMVQAVPQGRAGKKHLPTIPVGRLGEPEEIAALRRLPRRRRRRLHHRRDAHGQRRAIYYLGVLPLAFGHRSTGDQHELASSTRGSRRSS